MGGPSTAANWHADDNASAGNGHGVAKAGTRRWAGIGQSSHGHRGGGTRQIIYVGSSRVGIKVPWEGRFDVFIRPQDVVDAIRRNGRSYRQISPSGFYNPQDADDHREGSFHDQGDDVSWPNTRGPQ